MSYKFEYVSHPFPLLKSFEGPACGWQKKNIHEKKANTEHETIFFLSSDAVMVTGLCMSTDSSHSEICNVKHSTSEKRETKEKKNP